MAIDKFDERFMKKLPWKEINSDVIAESSDKFRVNTSTGVVTVTLKDDPIPNSEVYFYGDTPGETFNTLRIIPDGTDTIEFEGSTISNPNYIEITTQEFNFCLSYNSISGVWKYISSGVGGSTSSGGGSIGDISLLQYMGF